MASGNVAGGSVDGVAALVVKVNDVNDTVTSGKPQGVVATVRE